MNRVVVLLMAVGMSACSGSSFSSSGSGGSGTGGGSTGGQGVGGGVSSGGSSSGGSSSGGGSVGAAGATSSGGTFGGGGAGVAGGISAGGTTGAGGATGTDCSTLWADYQSKLDQARTCEPNTAGECSLDSFLPDQCGCPVYVNAKTKDEAAAAYQKYTTAGCTSGIACATVCIQPLAVHCAPDTGTTVRSVCTGG